MKTTRNPQYPYTEAMWRGWGVSVDCPICKAKRGQVCRTNGLARFGKPHKTRRNIIWKS